MAKTDTSNPEEAKRLRDLKAAFPKKRTANHELIDLLLDIAEHGTPSDLTAELARIGNLIDSLTTAHLETTVMVLDTLDRVKELERQ